jgi:GNAT superfamily N-acetyltransferase
VAGIELERIVDAEGAERCEVLFREYAKWSIGRLADECGMSMSAEAEQAVHAAFRQEWPALFAGDGRLYLAKVEDQPAGVGALKPIDDELGEIKRMYVRDAYRRHGVARLVLETLVSDARRIGFRTVRLETLSYMRGAIELYRSMGFVDVDRFEAEGAKTGVAQFELFMELAVD